MLDCIAEPIYLQASRTQSAILYHTQRFCKNRVGCRVAESLQRFKELPQKIAYPLKP
jgi:hypothetical protein